jgi:GNAT superfamily N-acetyltransferase
VALRIEKLTRSHAVDGFDCGAPPLNRFLERYALQNQQADASRTYVALDGDEVIGFYTLVVGEVAHANAPARVIKGLAKYPVPVMVLARLAVSNDRQGQGIGAGLLKDALLRIVAAADHAGIRAVAVHAKDEAARAFYERFDFERSPTDPYHLLLLMKDVRALLDR